MFLQQFVTVLAIKGHWGLFLCSLPCMVPVTAKPHGDPGLAVSTADTLSNYKPPGGVGHFSLFTGRDRERLEIHLRSQRVGQAGCVKSDVRTLGACVSVTLRHHHVSSAHCVCGADFWGLGMIVGV